jgi:hypothetical protein
MNILALSGSVFKAREDIEKVINTHIKTTINGIISYIT